MLFAGNTTNPMSNMTAIDTSTAVYSYGNYYNWYSATAGNGTYSFDTEDSSVTGSICPIGWKLPKGGQTTVNLDGDYYVLTKTLMNNTEPNGGSGHSYYYGVVNNVDLGVKASNSLRSYPSNFIYSLYNGFDEFGNWFYNYRVGKYWTSTAGDYEGNTAIFSFGYENVYPGTEVADGWNKDDGYTIRCVINN